MLVMFVVGIGSLGWMLVLAAVMAAEKNLPWGRRLRTPLGRGAPRLGGGDRRRQRLSADGCRPVAGAARLSRDAATPFAGGAHFS